jgi:hypothetical protein
MKIENEKIKGDQTIFGSKTCSLGLAEINVQHPLTVPKIIFLCSISHVVGDCENSSYNKKYAKFYAESNGILFI